MNLYQVTLKETPHEMPRVFEILACNGLEAIRHVIQDLNVVSGSGFNIEIECHKINRAVQLPPKVYAILVREI